MTKDEVIAQYKQYLFAAQGSEEAQLVNFKSAEKLADTYPQYQELFEKLDQCSMSWVVDIKRNSFKQAEDPICNKCGILLITGHHPDRTWSDGAKRRKDYRCRQCTAAVTANFRARRKRKT
jgi:RNase P subunit RPR2